MLRDQDGDRALECGLAELLALPLDQSREHLEQATSVDFVDAPLLAPVDDQEVWAAGVTYARSRDGRMEESDRRQRCLRPRLSRPSGPNCSSRPSRAGWSHRVSPLGIRADSPWNVPEAELGLVLNRFGEVFGYVAGNDVSSRSIEGSESALSAAGQGV